MPPNDMYPLVKDPIYLQVANQLKTLAQAPLYQSGGRFLSERDVADRFDVSRMTANKALAQLQRDGVLEYRRGVGMFAKREEMGYDLRGLVSFTDAALEKGYRPNTRVLSFEEKTVQEVSSSLRSQLSEDLQARVYEIERVRYLDGEPVIFETRWILKAQCPGLTREDAEVSLYKTFTKRFKLQLTGTRASLKAVNLSQRKASLLEVNPNSAAILISAVGFADEPLWVEETFYRGDKYVIEHVLGGSLMHSTPAKKRP
jgi:GntR family transcriptional regulator